MNFKKAFTMIELIFVIVILGILASIAVPKLQAVKHHDEKKQEQKFNDTFRVEE